MTSTYPTTALPYLAAISTAMEVLSAAHQRLAPPSCHLTVLDLRLIRPFLKQDERSDPFSCLLTPAEQKIMHSFRYDKRRLEWLGGRLAAKQALQGLDNTKKKASILRQNSSILPNEHGQPQIRPPLSNYPAAAVSISHSAGYAAALVCPDGCCGVDIQQKHPTLFKVQERFARTEELAAFSAIGSISSPLACLALLWAAKEAVKKCLLPGHPSFFGAITLNSVHYQPHEGNWIAQCVLAQPTPAHAMVRLGEMGEHALACAWSKHHA